MSVRTFGIMGLTALALTVAGTAAYAAPNLILNGDFETTTATQGAAQVNATNVSNWAVNGGYTFLFAPQGGTTSGTSADNAGGVGQYGNLKLWGPGDGSANGLTLSPTGGNFIAQDNNFQQAAITQTVGGLSVGTGYALSFYWAGVQQQGFSGTTQEQWTVNFGSQSFATPTVTLATAAFSGWTKVTTYFVASQTSQVLSFLATGSPGGAPPFSLLDGVSLVATPEPATWAMMLAGFVGVGFLVRRRGPTRRSAAIA